MNSNIKILTWFNFFTDFKLYAPLAIIYFAHVSGSYALGMSVFSIATVSSALFEVPTGIFSDRIGRKNTVIYGALSSVLYAIFYAIGQSFWILAIGAVFDGLSQAFYSGNNEALLYDTLADENKQHKYAEWLGKTSALFQVGLGVSAILGGILATWSFPIIMWISVIPQIFCVILSLLLKEPKAHSQKSGNIYLHLKDAYLQFLHNRKLRLLSISSILGYGLGEASYQFQSAFYNTVWPLWAIPIAKTFSNVGATIGFRFSEKVINKYDAFKIFVVDNVYNRIINSVAVIFPNPLSPILMSSTSVFYGIISVARNNLMQKEFSNDQRATMGSLNSFGGSLFFGVVALVLGLVADKLNPAQAFFILQFFLLGNLFVYWKLFKTN